MYIQSYMKKLSPMFFHILSCKTMKIKQKTSTEIEFRFFEIEIWFAWLGLHKIGMLIVKIKKCQLYFTLC